MLALGAQAMVKGASGVATAAGVSEQIIAMTLVAFGTSVPELAASAVAARHGEGDLSIGNILGSNLYNMTLILGTAASIAPISTKVELLSANYFFFLLSIFILFPMMRIRWRFGRIDGLILITIYISSVIFLFL
jgi:cation:H+ antiporter